MQERVPAGGRHGCAEIGNAGRLPRPPRHPVALPRVRLDPRAEPARPRHLPAVQSIQRVAACPPPGGALAGHSLRQPPPAVPAPRPPPPGPAGAGTRSPEQLRLEAIAADRLALAQDSAISGRRVLFHGHCHQKALAGTAATTALLRAIPGADVIEVDAGCCGMAGSFGFEAEHYELSMRIGELRLFPAIRAEPEDTIIAATGVSCRAQIAHATGRSGKHPLEIVRQALT